MERNIVTPWLAKILKNTGVSRRTTIAYTPQKHGVSERIRIVLLPSFFFDKSNKYCKLCQKLQEV